MTALQILAFANPIFCGVSAKSDEYVSDSANPGTVASRFAC